MEIVFVLGAARSGTSLLSRLLLDYFDVGMGPEGQWIVPLSRRAGRYGDLSAEGNVRPLVRDLLAEGMFEIVREQYGERFGWPIEVTEEKVMAAIREPTYAGIAYAALEVLARELRRSRVGSKDPAFARQLDELDALFGEAARYLAIVRDGRDVALSTMKQPWGQKSWYANALVWKDTYERIQAFGSARPDRFLAIGYEDLLRSPESTCRELERFLRADLGEERRAEFVRELARGARSDNYEKWRGRMSAHDHRLFESVAGPWLERLGYERVVPGARAHLWERAWYVTAEYARRARRKAALRLGLARPDVPTSTGPDVEGG